MNILAWKACKKLLRVATPLQMILDFTPGETHIFLNKQGVKILHNDGYKKISRYLNHHLPEINRGVVWADKGWKNFAHYLNPYKSRGIWPWPNAITECNEYFKQALQYWRQGQILKSMFFLGSSVHLVQDMCVPHHARAVALKGHLAYERWVLQNHPSYAIYNNGLYNLTTSVSGWVKFNAKMAWRHFPNVCRNATEDMYHQSTKELLTMAQRSTAGFFLYFINIATDRKSVV